MLLIGSIICCVARRRQKEVGFHKMGDIALEWRYNVDAGEDAEVNRSTGEYSCIATNSLSLTEYEEQIAVCTFRDDVADEYGSRDMLNDLCDRLTAMLNAAADEDSDPEVLENEHAVVYDVAQRTSDSQPAMYNEHGENGHSATAVVPHSATHTPLLSSQDYTTIPDKEPAEELYNTVDTAPQNEDVQATPPAAGYASIVEPERAQEGADDTEQPPPVPAFDPEILYAKPDKTSKAKGGHATVGNYEAGDKPHTSTELIKGAQDTETQPEVPSPTRAHCETLDFGYDTVPDTSGPTAEGGIEAVDILRQVYDKTSKGAKTKQPTCADGLYSTPDMSQKNRWRGSQGSVDGEGPKDTPPGTPTAADHLYATPDMSKKQRKQSHLSNGSPPEEQQGRDDDDNDTPPEVPLYQPITSHPGVNST